MKVWITYNSAIGLQFGGLERVWIHFRKPEWIDKWRDVAEDEGPFYDLSDMNGRLERGWKQSQGFGLGQISFGKLFGYNDRGGSEDEIAEYVWTELCKHFNCSFYEWDKVKVSSKDFLLELDLKISL